MVSHKRTKFKIKWKDKMKRLRKFEYRINLSGLRCRAWKFRKFTENKNFFYIWLKYTLWVGFFLNKISIFICSNPVQSNEVYNFFKQIYSKCSQLPNWSKISLDELHFVIEHSNFIKKLKKMFSHRIKFIKILYKPHKCTFSNFKEVSQKFNISPNFQDVPEELCGKGYLIGSS